MQALKALGIETGGDLMAADDFNARGYFEPLEIVAIHDELLATFDRSWGQPEHLLPIPPKCWDTAAADKAERRLSIALDRRLASISPDKILAIKDPRLSLVLPLWRRLAQRQRIDLQLILCLRHPVAVARSLEARDRITAPMAEALWFTYTTACLADSTGLPLYLNRHDDWLERPHDCLLAIAQFIGCSTPEEASTPFEHGLTHQIAEEEPTDCVVAQRWKELSALPFAQKVNPELMQKAQDDMRIIRHMEILAQAIRSELGETPSYLLRRELAALRKEQHEMRSRAEELLKAYQSEAQTSAELRTKLERLNPLNWLRFPRRRD
jgi:hypothetical protein